jgi:hypothetical protein
MTISKTEHLLVGVAQRQRIIGLARLAFIAFVVSAGLYTTALLVARLTGLIPDLFTPATLAIPTLAALAVAICILGLQRATRPSAIARLVDQKLGTNDLFLTAQAITCSAGVYQELVLSQAAVRATTTDATKILPFTPWRRSAITAAIIGLMAMGVLLLPQLDPFGREAERARVAKREHQLQLAQQAAKARVEALAQAHTDLPTSEAVTQQLTKLAATFDQLKKGDTAANNQKLNGEQKELGKALMQARDRQQFTADQDQTGDLQRLGTGDLSKAEAMRQELAKGESRAAQEKIDKIKELTEQLAKSSDPAQQQQLRAEIKQKLDQLTDALGKQGKQATQALSQAMDQLAQTGNPGTAKAALDALKDSLDLAKAELSSMAQGTRDVDQLKEALQTLQMARKLNELGDLSASGEDGQGNKGPGKKSLAEYKKLYAKLMQERGQGQGQDQGPGGGDRRPDPVQADGGTAKENNDTETSFNPERSRSQLTAGQTLMQWKTSGPAEKGVAREDYQRSLSEVRQGVSEALLHEQLPPGYQEAVKKYFDSLDPAAEKGK